MMTIIIIIIIDIFNYLLCVRQDGVCEDVDKVPHRPAVHRRYIDRSTISTHHPSIRLCDDHRHHPYQTTHSLINSIIINTIIAALNDFEFPDDDSPEVPDEFNVIEQYVNAEDDESAIRQTFRYSN